MYSHKLEAVVHRYSVKNGVLRNFAKFTGKYLCHSLFFNKVTGFRPGGSFKPGRSLNFSAVKKGAHLKGAFI